MAVYKSDLGITLLSPFYNKSLKMQFRGPVAGIESGKCSKGSEDTKKSTKNCSPSGPANQTQKGPTRSTITCCIGKTRRTIQFCRSISGPIPSQTKTAKDFFLGNKINITKNCSVECQREITDNDRNESQSKGEKE